MAGRGAPVATRVGGAMTLLRQPRSLLDHLRPLARAAVLGLGLFAASSVRAQSISSPWRTLNAGGGNSVSGSITLVSSIGNTEAARVEGDGYVLVGGFFGDVLDEPVTELPVLSISKSENQLVISWTPNSPGSVLQYSDTISGGLWRDLDAGSLNPATISATEHTRFFRVILRNP